MQQERLEQEKGESLYLEEPGEERTRLSWIRRRGGGKKRAIMLIAATLLLLSLVTLAANVANGNVEKMFEVIFGKETKNIGESGLELGISDTKEGMTLNVQGIVGDNNTMTMLFDLNNEKGESFQGNHIAFGKLNFNVEGQSPRSLGWSLFRTYQATEYSSSFGWGLIDKAYQTPTKRVFKLDANLNKDLIDKQATLEITDIIEGEMGEWFSEVNLGDYLKVYPQYIEQKAILTQQEVVGGSDEVADGPQRILESKKLDIILYPEESTDWKIDNIGFVDGELHIRMYGKEEGPYCPGFVDEQGNEVEMTYNVTSYYGEKEEEENNVTGYYVYAIKDLEELSKLRVKSYFMKKLKTTPGHWQVTFNIAIKNQEKVIDVKEAIPYKMEQFLKVEQMKLSNLSLLVSYKGKNVKGAMPIPQILFRDGRLEKLQYNNSTTRVGDRLTVSYAFEVPVLIDEVEAILINGVKIEVK